MSEERPRHSHWKYPKFTVDFFEARHFAHKIRHGKPIYPSLMDTEKVNWSIMYRIRINGKWFGPKSYSFFTISQVAELVTKMLEKENVLLIGEYNA